MNKVVLVMEDVMEVTVKLDDVAGGDDDGGTFQHQHQQLERVRLFE